MLISFVFIGYFYTLSIQPMKKKEKMGEKAWKYCEKVRMISGLFEFIAIINFFLWIWFPLPIVRGWIINKNMWIGVIIFVIVMIPLVLIIVWDHNLVLIDL